MQFGDARNWKHENIESLGRDLNRFYIAQNIAYLGLQDVRNRLSGWSGPSATAAFQRIDELIRITQGQENRNIFAHTRFGEISTKVEEFELGIKRLLEIAETSGYDLMDDGTAIRKEGSSSTGATQEELEVSARAYVSDADEQDLIATDLLRGMVE
ncbi:hypothetical protein ACIBEH_07820 [Nocardia salmonicida]|uniref:hypothetical protein n=1 Tax=Nocardia salmonicida TaxID=53431 RepID=UPI0034281151